MRTTQLADRMRNRADNDKLPADHPMRKLADAFDVDSHGYLSHPQVVKVDVFMDTWRRARQAWCDYTGEPML
jgi:hypothetical protein